MSRWLDAEISGPTIEHNRRTRVAPRTAAGWNRAARRADIAAEREVKIVPRQPSARQSRGVPELGEAGIFIDIDLRARRLLERFDRQVPADVDQQVRCFRGGTKLIHREPVKRLAAATDDARSEE